MAVAVRTMIDYYLGRAHAPRLTLEEAAIAKLFATETLWRCIDDMVQLHGGYGYMLEYPMARAFVDMRVTRIFGGTSEVHARPHLAQALNPASLSTPLSH